VFVEVSMNSICGAMYIEVDERRRIIWAENNGVPQQEFPGAG